jgi:uncharacterized protein YbaP (TraB family)
MITWLTCGLLACGPKHVAGTTGGSRPDDRPLLAWTVARDGGPSSLLVGTCHLQVPIARWLPPPHDAALEHARVMFTEVGELEIDPLAIFAMLDDGSSLRAAIGADAFDSAARVLRDIDMMAPVLDKFPPWMVSEMVEGRTSGARLSAFAEPHTQLLDLAIAARAGAAGVEVRPLETLEQQMDMLRAFDDQYEQALVPGSEVARNHASHTDAILEMCTRFEIEGVEAMLREPDPTGFDEALLTRRNEAWMTVIGPELRDGNVVVAVGAAHMLGEHGLLSLLQQDGFTVERLHGRGGLQERVTLPVIQPEDRVPDPHTLHLWTAHFQGPVTDQVCRSDAFLLTCGLMESTQACKAEMAESAAMCTAQWGDLLPPDGSQNEIADKKVLPCMLVGPLIQGVVDDTFGDAEACVGVRTAFEQAMAEATAALNHPTP